MYIYCLLTHKIIIIINKDTNNRSYHLKEKLLIILLQVNRYYTDKCVKKDGYYF